MRENIFQGFVGFRWTIKVFLTISLHNSHSFSKLAKNTKLQLDNYVLLPYFCETVVTMCTCDWYCLKCMCDCTAVCVLHMWKLFATAWLVLPHVHDCYCCMCDCYSIVVTFVVGCCWISTAQHMQQNCFAQYKWLSGWKYFQNWHLRRW